MDEIVEREIGLEGLEGLTLPSFWIRLTQEYKRLNTVTITGTVVAVTDTTTKAFRKAAWESVLQNLNIELYLLPEPRDDIPEHEYTDLENFAFRTSTEPSQTSGKRKHPDNEDDADETNNTVSMEDGEMEEPRSSKTDNSYTHGWKQERSSEPTIMNSYGVYLHKDATLRGSCRYLNERQNITEDMKRSKLTVDTAYKKYGNKLVLVASPTVRELCMGVSNLSKAESQKLTAQAYCVLEVIVRHRAHGCFLCLYGTTMLGFGVRNLKQVHNYTSILQDLGVVTKQKGRFPTNVPQQGAHQVLTYMFPTGLSRKVKNEMELYVDQVREAISRAPAPGIPMALLPRLSDYEKDQTNKFRKRLKSFFPELEVQTVPKQSLQDLYTNLTGDKNGMVSVVRLPARTNVEPSTSDSPAKGRPPCFVPEDLEVTPGPELNKSLMKATLLLFKVNRERGLCIPDLEAVFAEHKVTKKTVERLMRQVLKTGYIRPGGKFGGKNPAKRFVLVKNEEERHKRLAYMTGESVDLPTENPSSNLISTTTLQSRVLAWAEKFRVFEDARFLQTYQSFVESDFDSLGLGEVVTEVAKAVDAGLLRFHLVQKDIIQPGSSGFSTFLSSLDASPEELRTYIENTAFSTKVKSYLAPNKNIGTRIERNSTLRRITVYQTKSRVLRYRLFHRYLFCLAYESASPPPGGFKDWRSRIRHVQLAKNLKGWVTFEDILRNMPLAVFARLTPLTSPADDEENVIKNSVEHETTAILPLSEQSTKVLRHILSDRTFVHLLRSILFCLRQMGLVTFGLSDGFWPDRTELYYIHDELTLKDTMAVPSAQIATGVMDVGIAAEVPDMHVSFSSDYDVVNFWHDVGNQTVSTKPRTRTKKPKSDSEHPLGNLLLPVVRKKQENKLASQHQVKEAMPEVLQQMTPQTLVRPSRPPGSRLALCGFDPIVRLHVRYFWLHAEQASRNMQKEDGYIPELDSFQLDHLGATRRRKQADRGLDKPKYKKVRITTNGRAKRGPKRIEPKSKPLPDTVKRAFGNRWNGQLFRETLPWKMHEKLMMIVYIGARDLLPRLKQKRPSHVAIFPDLMEEYFPDAPLRRSRREVDVHLAALQRDDTFMRQTEAIRDAIELDPKAQAIIKKNEARKDVKANWTLSEQYEEWRQLVRIGMDLILSRQKCSRADRFLTNEDPRRVNATQGPSDHECIRQFVLGNLVMHTVIRGAVDHPRALNVAMRKEDQRVSVGMGFHLNFRGVIVTKKIFERHPDMVVNLGGIGMGPSMRFKDFIRAAGESWLGVAVNEGQIGDMTGEVDPRNALPFYFDALKNHAAENHWSSDELDKRVGISALSSYLEENELFQEAPDSNNAPDLFKFVAVPGLHLEDNSFLGMSKLVQYEIVGRFEAVKKEIEAVVPWSATADEHLSSIAFEYDSKIFNRCTAIKNLVAEKQAAGVTKKFIWDAMDKRLHIPIEECPGIFDILQQRHLIIPAGIEEVLYVSADHMAPWLTRAHNDQTKAFQPRPWLSFDGAILGDILYSHLQLVLLRICEKSSSSLSSSIRHFQPFFFGRNTIEIVEILVSLHLVKKIRCDSVDGELIQLPITKDVEWLDDGDTEHIYVECRESVWHSVMGLSFLKELLHVSDKEPFSSGSAGSARTFSQTEDSQLGDSQLEATDSQEEEEEEPPASSKRSREQRVVRKRALSLEAEEDTAVTEAAEAGEAAEEGDDNDDAANAAEISEDESEHDDEVEELDADFFATSDGQDTEEE